jgi:hypothetical protein
MRILALAVLAALALMGTAHPQDFVTTAAPVSAAPGDTMVDVNSWYALLQPYLTMLASAVVTLAVGIITAKVSQWTGIQVEAKHRDALQTALTNGAGLLIQELGASAATVKGLNVGNNAAAKAIDYVLKASPDAIKYFDRGPDSIAKKLEAKLGLLTPVGGVGAVPVIPVTKPPG